MIFPAGQYLCLPQQNASLGGNKMRFDVMPVATEKQISEIETTANNVWHNYYKDIFSKEQISYMLEKYQSKAALKKQIEDRNIYYMLLVDGQLAGYLCFKNHGDHIFISRLYIKAEFRRQGLARRSISLFDNMVKGEEFSSIKKLCLHVERKNSFAINVYEHLGFQKIKAVDTDIGNGFVCSDYVMERTIKREQGDNNGK